MWQYQNTDELYHHGILGMKWGIRRYQNKDGSLTPAGKRMQKRKQKYLDKTSKMAKTHKSNAKYYRNQAQKYEKMSDKQYKSMFDDKDIFELYGGSKKMKQHEINEYKQKEKNSKEYAKDWLDAHNEIMRIPVNKRTTNKEYKNIINKYMNRRFNNTKETNTQKTNTQKTNTQKQGGSKTSTDKEYKKIQNDFKKVIRNDYEDNKKLISFTKNELKNKQSKKDKEILKQTLNKLNEDKKKLQKDLDDIDNRSDFYTKEYFKNKRN